MQICPSILEPTAESLFTTINKLSPFYKYFQIDIADGVYVNNKTVQIDEIKDTLNKDSLPEDCLYDFHLMVKDYISDINKLNVLKKSIDIRNIFIHLSAIENFEMKIEELSSLPIGLTLNPQDQVDDLVRHYNLTNISTIQIMSVTPGVQGNPFLPDTLKKIEQIRVLGYRNEIFLDGAVNDKTLPFINEQKFKPDVVCPGSFLTKAKDLEKNVKYLKQLT